jgi:hypothetical protein
MTAYPRGDVAFLVVLMILALVALALASHSVPAPPLLAGPSTRPMPAATATPTSAFTEAPRLWLAPWLVPADQLLDWPATVEIGAQESSLGALALRSNP